ncbi:GMC family oxidoreductase N-terminal domain-containing protein [Streptomyces sp. NPDC005953]|uniref:GMC family oxidoreductase n=1 Tax=Streptomyces sp. NPDC005953 TaxID=3156719 RepID=UPI0033F97C98
MIKASLLHFDHVVVGAGSTGAVIAARLAEWTDGRVLLVEAGPDYHGRLLPFDLENGRTPALGSHDWGYNGVGTGLRDLWLPRGKVVGGCSAVNTCIALRPEPTDFEGWPSGQMDWSWEQVLKAFVDMETDADHADDYHGDRGPLRLSRIQFDQLTPLSRAFLSVCQSAGFDRIDDHNEPGSTGVGMLPLNLESSLRRISTATAYLSQARMRKNLTVLANTVVDSVVFAGTRSVGVTIIKDGIEQQIDADNVTIAAGAYGSPAILMRSGIGPVKLLRSLGIDIVVDLPCVGRNLADHSQVPLICTPLPGVINTAAPCAEVVLRYRADGWSLPNDMQLCLLNHVDIAKYAPSLADRIDGSHAFVVSANLMRPDSRGTVELIDRDPHRPPLICLNRVSAPSDRRRLRNGLRLARQIATDEGFDELFDGLLDADEVEFNVDASVDRYVVRRIESAHHPSGTAAMATDPANGVVDNECRVFGTDGLRIADASIIPSPLRANTNLACIMIGERVARLLAGASPLGCTA